MRVDRNRAACGDFGADGGEGLDGEMDPGDVAEGDHGEGHRDRTGAGGCGNEVALDACAVEAGLRDAVGGVERVGGGESLDRELHFVLGFGERGEGATGNGDRR